MFKQDAIPKEDFRKRLVETRKQQRRQREIMNDKRDSKEQRTDNKKPRGS